MANRTDFSAMACSIARTWHVIGESWTPLVLRDLILGVYRFDDLRVDLGVSANILTDRLGTLERAGVIERRPYKTENRSRDGYHLTEMGEALVPIIVAITTWGDRWLSDSVPPAVFDHSTCNSGPVTVDIGCSACGEPVTADTISARPGPGAVRQRGTLLIAPKP